MVLSDIVAGRINAYFPAAPSLPTFYLNGKVRPIAVTYKKPTPLAPGLPLVADTVPGFELLGWYGLQVGSSASELQTFLNKETARWDKVLREGGTIPGGKG